MRASAFAPLLSLSLAACGGPPAPDPRGVARDEVLVQVTASGRADTRPDEARFAAGVSTIQASAAAASAANNQAMNRVVAALRGLGIRPDDVQTRTITLNRLDYGPNRGRFEANNVIEVRVRDLAKAGQAIAAATEAGANVLSGPNLQVGDPEMASRSAYAEAYRAARARAEAYAQAAELRVVRVLAIRDAQGEAMPLTMAAAGMDLERAAGQTSMAPPPVQTGVNTSEVGIRVDFALAPR
ncbi:MAG TPA: SIMPL domain-containing protein [Allosphingosinicella sp.]|nr:SIMPL domain-containing protein [Allosphingosinicella sp.]